jgi:hypothetical protein
MVYEDLDAGDDSRRNGDHIAYDHPDAEGDARSGVTINRGRLVTLGSGGVLAEAKATGDDVLGVLQDYGVYGDTGKEKVKGQATVKTDGAVLANLSKFSPTVGSYLDDNANVFVSQQVGDTDVYEVILR